MKTYPAYLNGDWLVTEESIPVTNPATEEVIAHMSVVDRAHVAQAIRDAHAAFAAWRQLTAKAREEFLHKLANELERQRDEIARTITLENGKPLKPSQGQVAM